ncbi:MAG: hypothetical protein ABIL09_18385, partial [Gemmatimonadota bacterium]
MSDLHDLLPRIQIPGLPQTLAGHPVVVLQGARQTGKTTIARGPDIGAGRDYLTLDDLANLATARIDPETLFRRLMGIAAGQNGRLANAASMARDAGLSPATARRYLGHLEVSFQLLR